MGTIKHAKVSAKADGADASLVRPSDWNAPHTIDPGSIGTVDLADGGVTAAKLAPNAGVPNLFKGSVFTFTDDWCYVGPLYASGGIGTIGTPLGIYCFTSQPTHTASIIGLTGTGRLGLCALQTGTTTDGQCRVNTCAMGAFDAGGTGNMQQISFEAVCAFDAQSSGTDEYTAQVGLVGNAPGYGCYFRYQRTVGGHKWIAVTSEGGVETTKVLDGTGGTVDAGTIQALSLPSFGMFRLKVIYKGTTGVGTSAEFWVNDVLCATITTNLPTHSLAGSVEILKTAGTTSRYLALDYTCLEYTFRLTRVP